MRCIALLLALSPLLAMADPKQECVTAGRVFQDGIRALSLEVAYGEKNDWRRVDYHMLSKQAQLDVEIEVEVMRGRAKTIVDSVREDVPKWRREGLDADKMMRDILVRGVNGLDEKYAIDCLKKLSK